MEKEQLLEALKLYKQQLADAVEERIIFQVLVAKQANQIQQLEEQIRNLNAQLNERDNV